MGWLPMGDVLIEAQSVTVIEDDDFTAMPILADALQDAGCEAA